jgi:hypothetical protein
VTNILLLVASLILRQLHVRAGSESNRGCLIRAEAHSATRRSLHGGVDLVHTGMHKLAAQERPWSDPEKVCSEKLSMR